MKIYKLQPSEYKAAKRAKLLRISVSVGIGLIILIVSGQFRFDTTSDLLTSVIVFAVLGVVLIITLRQAFRKQKEGWLSFELTMTDDSLSQAGGNLLPASVHRDEISKIQKRDGHLFVFGAKGNRPISIPKRLIGFEEVEAQLQVWYEHEYEVLTKWNLKGNVIGAVFVISAVIFLFFSQSTGSLLTLFLGLVAIGSYVYLGNYLLSNIQFDRKIKWIIVLGGVFFVISMIGVLVDQLVY